MSDEVEMLVKKGDSPKIAEDFNQLIDNQLKLLKTLHPTSPEFDKAIKDLSEIFKNNRIAFDNSYYDRAINGLVTIINEEDIDSLRAKKLFLSASEIYTWSSYSNSVGKISDGVAETLAHTALRFYDTTPDSAYALYYTIIRSCKSFKETTIVRIADALSNLSRTVDRYDGLIFANLVDNLPQMLEPRFNKIMNNLVPKTKTVDGKNCYFDGLPSAIISLGCYRYTNGSVLEFQKTTPWIEFLLNEFGKMQMIDDNTTWSAAICWTLAACATVNRSLLYEWEGIFGIDKNLYQRMLAISADWDPDYLINETTYNKYRALQRYNAYFDFAKMAQITMTGRKPPFFQTIFNDTNITCFRNYTFERIFHQHDNRTKQTGPIFLAIISKRDWNGGDFAPSNIGTQFDFRAIEPGKDYNIEPLLANLSGRLVGIEGQLENIWVTGHGGQAGIELEVKKGTETPQSRDGELDLWDEKILNGIKKYLVPSGATLLLVSCSTAETGEKSFAYFVAKTLHARVFASSAPTAGIKKIIYDLVDPSKIVDVEFYEKNKVVYDFRDKTDVRHFELENIPVKQEFVHPNPTSSNISISISRRIGETAMVEIFTMLGQKVGRLDDIEIPTSKIEIDLKTFVETRGTYIVNVEYMGPKGTRNETYKVVLSD